MQNLSRALPQFYQSLPERPPAMEFARTRADFESYIDSHLDKRVSFGTAQDNMGLVLWRNQDKLNLHIVNYDFNYATGLVNEKNGLSLMIDAQLVPQPSRVAVISLDRPEFTELLFNIKDGFLSFSVPALHVWDIVIIE